MNEWTKTLDPFPEKWMVWCQPFSKKKKWCGSVNLSAKRKKNNGGLRL